MDIPQEIALHIAMKMDIPTFYLFTTTCKSYYLFRNIENVWSYFLLRDYPQISISDDTNDHLIIYQKLVQVNRKYPLVEIPHIPDSLIDNLKSTLDNYFFRFYQNPGITKGNSDFRWPFSFEYYFPSLNECPCSMRFEKVFPSSICMTRNIFVDIWLTFTSEWEITYINYKEEEENNINEPHSRSEERNIITEKANEFLPNNRYLLVNKRTDKSEIIDGMLAREKINEIYNQGMMGATSIWKSFTLEQYNLLLSSKVIKEADLSSSLKSGTETTDNV